MAFKTGYSAQAEATRLAQKYGFTVTSVFTIISGFAARLPSSTVTSLRCESSVASVEFSRTNIPPP